MVSANVRFRTTVRLRVKFRVKARNSSRVPK